MTEQLHFHFSLSYIGEGNGNPLQYSCLENPRDREAWWAAVYGVAQSRTRLRWLSSSSSNSSSPIINKGPSIQSYCFSSGHVWMWELDYKESWVPKNWCFWIVVMEKTFESPSLDCKEIKPVNPKGNQPWIFTGWTDVEAEVPILWLPDAKCWLIGKGMVLGKIEGKGKKGNRGWDS